MGQLTAAGASRNSGIAFSSGPVVGLTVKRQDQSTLELKGRLAFTLNEMIEAGASGITAISYPGVRVSHSILLLRKAGFSIETVEERHGGAFTGRHGRYVLRTPLTIVSAKRVAE